VSKAVSFEAPFIFLLFGNERAVLFNTGPCADPAKVPVGAGFRHPQGEGFDVRVNVAAAGYVRLSPRARTGAYCAALVHEELPPLPRSR
jgi:hypothetical protein